MSPPKALAARLSALHAASFFSHGIYLPFFPLWLLSKGLNPAIIGIVVAIPIIVRILATAPLLSLADRSFGARRLLLVSHLGQVVMFPLLLLAQDTVVIIVLVALVSFAQAAVIPTNDLVTTVAVQRYPGLNYGRLRSAGSISFFLANIAGGYLVVAFGAGVVPIALTLIPILGITATLTAIPPSLTDIPAVAASELPLPKALPAVLWVLIAGAALTQGSHGALNAFGTIYWQSLGFADSTIGYFWAGGVMAEFLVFLCLGNAVGRGAGIGLLLMGSSASAIRFTIMAFQPDMATTFVLQAMHSLSFGASHLGAMAALTALAPLRARGRAQGIYASAAAFVTAGATIASGVIYRESGPAVFAAMAPLGLAGFALTLVAARLRKGQPQSAG
ncbi:MFS transporter [Microvirga antarctica]|uniref:MFS transporter n=1 Tax=Microvirga antarctica TaxID=2819233 RepID=UPI001B310534|nr:MFS transporter [Microvirga antarctica]